MADLWGEDEAAEAFRRIQEELNGASSAADRDAEERGEEEGAEDVRAPPAREEEAPPPERPLPASPSPPPPSGQGQGQRQRRRERRRQEGDEDEETEEASVMNVLQEKMGERDLDAKQLKEVGKLEGLFQPIVAQILSNYFVPFTFVENVDGALGSSTYSNFMLAWRPTSIANLCATFYVQLAKNTDSLVVRARRLTEGSWAQTLSPLFERGNSFQQDDIGIVASFVILYLVARDFRSPAAELRVEHLAPLVHADVRNAMHHLLNSVPEVSLLTLMRSRDRSLWAEFGAAVAGCIISANQVARSRADAKHRVDEIANNKRASERRYRIALAVRGMIPERAAQSEIQRLAAATLTYMPGSSRQGFPPRVDSQFNQAGFPSRAAQQLDAILSGLPP